MYLKRLELIGFKSFAKKTTLSFDVPVVSVVGPNGSGKSNIVEAVRFVLGEQSMKSMRGKSGSDLIWNGAHTLPKASRAHVEIAFDNTKRIFRAEEGSNLPSLEFDEVLISREVFTDGGNTYKVNGTEVRLKDISELLSRVHIGSSGYHIISQGEADRMLLARPKERREMLEDALGLKLYQYRLKESERKLDRTAVNIKEVEAMRREIVPHLKFLKTQVDKAEKAESLREELKTRASIFFAAERVMLEREHDRIAEEKIVLEESIRGHRAVAGMENKHALSRAEENTELIRMEEALDRLSREKIDLERNIGKAEGLLDFLTHDHVVKELSPIPRAEAEQFAASLLSIIASVSENSSVEDLRSVLMSVKEQIHTFASTIHEDTEDKNAEAKLLQEKTIRELTAALEEIRNKENTLRTEIHNARVEENSKRESLHQEELESIKARAKLETLEAELRTLVAKAGDIAYRKSRFEEDLKEVSVLTGPFSIADASQASGNHEDERRAIERLKIKLEDTGALPAEDITREFREATERDAFLTRELADLGESMKGLKDIMHDLEEKIETDFRDGVKKINKEFQEFFALMFGGGSAFLTVLKDDTPKPEEGEEEDMDAPKEKKKLEYGLDISVTLPRKKVRDLSMLSGGERSLTSIALLFAISQVNPPPFLVLDETDAALDEANSRRYGDMIELLSKYSQLVVVTHNRETMSRAGLLYGITMGSDGASKLLSVKLEEAVKIAK